MMACVLRLMLVLGVSMLFQQSRAQDAAKGRHFLLAFMDHRLLDGIDTNDQNLFLYISNPGSAVVQGEIGFYNFASESPISFHLLPGATVTVYLKEELMLRGPMKHRKSVYVTSNSDVQVQLFQETYQTRKSYGGTAVLPVTSLSTDYVAATHCVRRHCVLLVVAAESGTEVKVTFRVGEKSDSFPGQAMYDNSSYSDETELVERLEQGESIQVKCYRCDMTGTRVTSTKPVAVFSGGDFTKVAEVQKRDMVLEQMIPSKAIGQHYVLGSNYLPPTGEKVKVVPLQAGTRFLYNITCYESTLPRQVFSFIRPSDEIVEIVAEDQIMVVQLIRSDNRSETPNSIMNLPVPVFQWASSYRVYVPGPDLTENSTADTVHLCLLVPANTMSVLSGNVTVPSPLVTTQGDYKLLTLGLNAEHLLEVKACSPQSCQPFTGFVMKSKTSRTWSVTLRSTIPDFKSNATYAKKADDACPRTVLTTAPADTTDITTTSTPITTLPDITTTSTPVTTLTDVTTTSSPVTTFSDVTTTSISDTTLTDVITISSPDTTLTGVTTASSPDTTLTDVTTTSSPVTTLTDVTTTSSPDTTLTDVTTTSSPDTTLTDVTTTSSPNTTLTDVTTVSSPNTTLPDVTTASSPNTTLPDVPTTSTPDTTLTDVTTTSSPDTSLPDVTTTLSPVTTFSDVTMTSRPDTTLTNVSTTSSPDTTLTDVTTTSSPDTTLTDVTTTSSPDTTLSDVTTTLSLVTTFSDVTTTSTPDTTLTDVTTKLSPVTTFSDVITTSSSDSTTTATTTEDFSHTTHTTVTTSPDTVNVTTAQQETTSSSTTITTTTSTTTTTRPPSPPPRMLCACRCDSSVSAVSSKRPMSAAERREMAARVSRKIHDELTTVREKLSSFLRAKASSKDDRASSTLVGIVGIFLFAVIFGIVLFSDVTGLVIYVTEYRRRRLEEMEAKIGEGKEWEEAGGHPVGPSRGSSPPLPETGLDGERTQDMDSAKV